VLLKEGGAVMPATRARVVPPARARVMLARALAMALCAGGLLPALGRTAAAAECSELAGVKLEHATVSSAEAVGSGGFGADGTAHPPPAEYSGLPAFCRVRGVSTPVAGSEIGFEVWLPRAKDWSRRLHMVGNGAYSSRIYYAQMVARIRAGDVAVATDTGHQGSELTFAIGHPQRIVDFAHRAVHESVLAAKALTKTYYGASPAFSYFSGCSTGGYQALMAAQRHPQDFDGIIAGDPGNNRSNLTLAFLWNYLSNHPHGDDQHQIVPNEKLLLINRAVVAACDRLDGVTDGVISDPRSCHFDLQSLQCPKDEASDCLTRARKTPEPVSRSIPVTLSAARESLRTRLRRRCRAGAPTGRTPSNRPSRTAPIFFVTGCSTILTGTGGNSTGGRTST